MERTMSFDIRQQVEKMVGTFATTSLNQDSSGYTYGDSSIGGSAKVQNGNIYHATYNVSSLAHTPAAPSDDGDLNTSLLLAAFEGQTRRAKNLIDRGADVNYYDPQGMTPLHWTALKGFDDVSQILIDHGADVNWQSSFGSPLCFAALRGNVSAVKLLLAHRASPFSSNNCPLGTALHCACWYGDVELIDIIWKASKKKDVDWVRILDENALRLVDGLAESYRGDNPHDESDTESDRGSDDDYYSDDEDDLRGTQERTDIEPETLTPFMIAAYRGHLEAVKGLVARGANVKMVTQGGYKYRGATVMGSTVLSCAAAGRRLEVMRYLLAEGAEVNKAQHNGITALLAAAYAGSPECLGELFDHGASIATKQSADGFNALMLASACMHKEGDETGHDFPAVIQLLLAHGMDANARTNDGQTALMFMGRSEEAEDNVSVAQMLIDAGTDIDARDNTGNTALIYTARKAPSVASLLLEKGADVTPAPNSDGMSALHTAALFNHDGLILELFARGADFDWRSPTGNTALMLAAGAGNLASVKLIVELCSKEHLDAKNENRMTAHMYACARGFFDIVTVLLDAGATATAKDLFHAVGHRNYTIAEKLLQHGANFEQEHRVNGETPLHWAAMWGYCRFIKLFLEYGADINALDDRGRAPISHAAASGRARAVEVLLDSGADATILDNGRHPLDAAGFAASTGAVSVLRTLIQYGMDLDKRYAGGDTLLCIAALCGRRDAVNFLLDQGADANLFNDNGDTALSYAERSDHEEAEEIALSLWGRMRSPPPSPIAEREGRILVQEVEERGLVRYQKQRQRSRSPTRAPGTPQQHTLRPQNSVASLSLSASQLNLAPPTGPMVSYQAHQAPGSMIRFQQQAFALQQHPYQYSHPMAVAPQTGVSYHFYGMQQYAPVPGPSANLHPAYGQLLMPYGQEPQQLSMRIPSTYGLLKYAAHTYISGKIAKRAGGGAG